MYSLCFILVCDTIINYSDSDSDSDSVYPSPIG